MERRNLFKTVVAGSLAGTLAPAAFARPASPDGALPPLPTLTDPGERRGDMPYRKLGRTGEMVSAIGFGGSHFAKPTIEPIQSAKLCLEAIISASLAIRPRRSTSTRCRWRRSTASSSAPC